MEWHHIGVQGQEDPLRFGEARWPYQDFVIHATSFWLTKILCGKSNTVTRKRFGDWERTSVELYYLAVDTT
jgi:hypothetical protein